MKLPLFTKNKDNKQSDKDAVQLALDIGTEFVKAVIFRANKFDNKISVLGYGRSKQHSNAMQGAMIINLTNVINACDRAIGTALEHADKKESAHHAVDENYKTPIPSNIVMGIAGELVQGVTIMADYEREEPEVKIEEEETNEVIARIKEQAFVDAAQDISEETGIAKNKLQEINSKINSTYIDNVKVDNPLGFTGKDVSYKIFSTFAPSLHVNSLKEIAGQLGINIKSIEVEPYAISRAVKNARNKDYGAIFIDIGGGTTDVAVVNQGSIAGTKMFAYGGRVFTNRIAKDLNIELHEAEKMKIKYSAGDLDDKVSTKIKKALRKDIDTWVEGVHLALEEIEDVESYPTVIYLCGGGSALPEIKEALLEYAWIQNLPFMKHPKVEFLFPSALVDIEDLTESLIKPEDVTPLALARMFLET